jgi:hypothetical protein
MPGGQDHDRRFDGVVEAASVVDGATESVAGASAMGAALTLLIVGATFLSAGIVASSASFTIAFLTTVSAAVAASDSTGTAVTSTDAEVPDIVASSVAASDALVTTAAAVITGTFVTVASIPAATASFSVINIGNGAGCKDDNIAAINGR